MFFDVAIVATSVAAVDVRCSESSLHGPEKAALHVKRSASGYSDGKRAIDVKLLSELMKALDERRPLPIDEVIPSLDELKQAATRWADSRRASKAQRKKIFARIEERERVAEGVKAHYRSRWTDDYPFCQLVVEVDGGKKIEASTKDQHAYMMSWKIADQEVSSPHLSKALAAILPENFLQRDRLLGARLADDVVEWIGDERFNP
jgi:hypothetical protein